MTVDEIRDGEAIFLDANIFVYHLCERTSCCHQTGLVISCRLLS